MKKKFKKKIKYKKFGNKNFRHKRYNAFKNKNKNRNYYKLAKIIFILLFLIIIYLLKNNNSGYYSKFGKKLRKNIIDVNINKQFENIKKKYYTDSFLKPYLEKINLLSHLYHKKIVKLKRNKNNIHICMSFNNRYLYQILVSITMVLENCDKNNTFVTYHILCNPDVKNTTLSILKSLIYKYYSNLEMIFYDMGDNFKNRNDLRLSQSAYYRLLTPVIIDIDKIIYLDGDTIILKDLNEMYQLPFNDNYILGFLDVLSNGVDYLGIKSERYINSGVVLLNLDKMRNDNKIYDILNMTNSPKHIPYLDQSIINYVFYPKIGILPSKFGIWNFSDKKDIQIYLSHLRTKLDIIELEQSLENPSIIHNVLCVPKIFSNSSRYIEALTTCNERGNCSCEKYHNLWYYYANMTDYYENISNLLNK